MSYPLDNTEGIHKIPTVVAYAQDKIYQHAIEQGRLQFGFLDDTWFEQVINNFEQRSKDLDVCSKSIHASIAVMQDYVRPYLERLNGCPSHEGGKYRRDFDRALSDGFVLGRLCIQHFKERGGDVDLDQDHLLRKFEKESGRLNPAQFHAPISDKFGDIHR